jgi:hypothetical protein
VGEKGGVCGMSILNKKMRDIIIIKQVGKMLCYFFGCNKYYRKIGDWGLDNILQCQRCSKKILRCKGDVNSEIARLMQTGRGHFPDRVYIPKEAQDEG